jgi:hypothetical protein
MSVFFYSFQEKNWFDNKVLAKFGFMDEYKISKAILLYLMGRKLSEGVHVMSKVWNLILNGYYAFGNLRYKRKIQFWQHKNKKKMCT